MNHSDRCADDPSPISTEACRRGLTGRRWRVLPGGWLGAVLALVTGLVMGLVALPTAAQPAASGAATASPALPARPYFAVPRLAASLSLGAEVLSPQERAFIASLPEIRVGIPLPPVRPYEVLGDNGEVTGIHAEMLGYLSRALGLRMRPVLLPDLPSVLQAAQRREVDLVMTLGYTADRARYLEFTLGVTPLPGALFARTATTAQVAAPEANLSQARFAIERDFLANDHVRRQYPQATILTVENTGQALRAVAEGRADYYLGALLTTIDWLTREPVPGIEVNRLLNYGTGYYHFAVRKDWAPLVPVLNKGISSLRAQGLSPGRISREWNAAAASLPAGVPMPEPLQLNAREMDALVRRPVWRVGAVRGLPLLNQLESDGTHTGVAAEATEQVARRLGVGVQVVGFDNVGLMLDALRRGEIDVVPFLTRTAEREREFVYSRPYVEMPYVIVARIDAPLYWNLDSLRGRTLALAAQHPLRPLLLQRYPDIRIVDVADGREAMDAVAARRADAAVEVKLFANLRINGDNDGTLRTVSTVEEVPAQFHFATTQAERGLLTLVDRALQDIPEADLLRMRRRWVAIDLNPSFPWKRWQPLLLTGAAALLLMAGGTAWWLRRLSLEVQARRRSEDRLRDIGATVPGVAFRHIFGPDGQQLVASWVSSRAQDLLGQAPPARQTLLSSLAPRLSAADRQALADAERLGLAEGQRLHRTVAYEHPDGRRRWLTCEAVRTDAERGHKAWTGYLIDNSQEHELQARLVDAAQSRNLMLASASHELRAPAHTLSLALQALSAEGLSPAQGRALRIARDAVDTLSLLMSDVLDAARFDGAPLRVRGSDFVLRELINKLGEGAAANAASKGLAFVMHIDPTLPERIHLDPLRLRQVVVNLLSNAFKYTPSGRVELVALRRVPGPDTPAGLAITVADTGPGIEPALRDRLFTPFATAPADGAPLVPDEGSSGLGLSICRQLTERLGGRLELTCTPGQGTRATVLLPLHEAGPAPAPAPRAGAVLVCDDDATSRLLMAHVLRDRGFRVEEAEQAEAALARCRQGGIAAVVTDLEMPGLGGAGLLRALHDQASQGLPLPALVVCSGDSVDADGSIDTRGLADARLIKPVDLPQLLQVLASLGVQPTPA